MPDPVFPLTIKDDFVLDVLAPAFFASFLGVFISGAVFAALMALRSEQKSRNVS